MARTAWHAPLALLGCVAVLMVTPAESRVAVAIAMGAVGLAFEGARWLRSRKG